VPNKNYIRGRQFEYRVKKELEMLNDLVMRTAGSHSPFDLIAVTKTHIHLVQCKNHKPSKEDIEKLNIWSKKLMTDNNNTSCLIIYKTKNGLAYKWGNY